MITKVKKIVDNSNHEVKANFKKFVNENSKVLNSKDSKAINEKLKEFLSKNGITHDNFEPITLKNIINKNGEVYAVLEKYRRENNRLYVEAKKVFENIAKDGKYHCGRINEAFSVLEHRYSHLTRRINENYDIDLTIGTFVIDSIDELKDNFDQKFVESHKDDFDDVALNDFFYGGDNIDLIISKDSSTISGYTARITLNSTSNDFHLKNKLNDLAKNYFESSIVDYIAESINEDGNFSDDKYDIFAKAKASMKPEDIDHHASDLYLKVNDISTKLVADYMYPQNVTKFKSQIDNDMWYDIPFAWYKESVNENANINVGVIKIKSMDELAKTLGKFFTDHKKEFKTEELERFFDYGGSIELDVKEKSGTSTGYGVEPTYTTGANYGYMLDNTTSQDLDRLFDLYYELDVVNYPKSVNEDANLNIGDKVSVFDDNFKYPEYYGIVKSINDDTVNLEIRDKTDRVVNSSFNTTLNGVSEPFGDVNEDATEPEIISQLRKIVSDSQYQDLTDSVTGSKMTVDMGSAANMLQIYDNINDAQKTDFVSKSLKGMFDMTNKIFKKFESVNESAYSEVINESSEDDYKQLEQEYQTKKKELFSFGNGWTERFGNNISKNYGDEKYIKILTISIEADFVAHKIYYQVRVGYSKTPNYGAEADKYYSEQNKLSDTQFTTIQDAANAADKFANDWNSKPINESGGGSVEYVDATELVKEKIKDWDGKGVLRFDLANPLIDEDKQLFLTTSGRDVKDKFQKPYQVMLDNKSVIITDLDNIDKKGNIINESANENYIAEYTQKDEKFRYMLLSRMQSDCDYFLGNGHGSENQLFMGDKTKQIKLMNALWDSFTDKPEWLSKEQITDYASKMGVSDTINEDYAEKRDKLYSSLSNWSDSDLKETLADLKYNGDTSSLEEWSTEDLIDALLDDKSWVESFSINEDNNSDEQKLTNFYIACSAINNYGYQFPQEIFDEYLTDENMKTFLDECDKIMKDSNSDDINDNLSECIKQQVESIFPKNIILQYT